MYHNVTENTSALKRKKILAFVTTLMNVEDIIPNEIIQSQKNRNTP
jgi:hypothetical protein